MPNDRRAEIDARLEKIAQILAGPPTPEAWRHFREELASLRTITAALDAAKPEEPEHAD